MCPGQQWTSIQTIIYLTMFDIYISMMLPKPLADSWYLQDNWIAFSK